MQKPRRWLVMWALAATPSIRYVPPDDALPTLIEAATRRTGRAIELAPAPLPEGISAIWSSDLRQDLIEYSSRVPSATAFLGVAHELGHILCRHESDKGIENFGHMTTGVSPDLAGRLLRTRSATTHYDREEAEAEWYARVIYRRALRAYAFQSASRVDQAFNLASRQWKT